MHEARLLKRLFFMLVFLLLVLPLVLLLLLLSVLLLLLVPLPTTMFRFGIGAIDGKSIDRRNHRGRVRWLFFTVFPAGARVNPVHPPWPPPPHRWSSTPPAVHVDHPPDCIRDRLPLRDGYGINPLVDDVERTSDAIADLFGPVCFGPPNGRVVVVVVWAQHSSSAPPSSPSSPPPSSSSLFYTSRHSSLSYTLRPPLHLVDICH